MKAVVAINQSAFGKELYAYILPNQSILNVSEVRQFLQIKLPHYMVPVKFLKIDEVPLTLSGKIDKKRLPFVGKKIEFLKLQDSVNKNSTVEQTIISAIQCILQCGHIEKNRNF